MLLLKTLGEALLNLLFPAVDCCPLCTAHSAGNNICPRCSQWLAEQQAAPCCYRCGRLALHGALCTDCLHQDWPFTLARAVAPYRGPLKEAVKRFKYRGRWQLAQPLGQLMLQQARSCNFYQQAELVVPVPMSRNKQRRRGFNQAVLLAREVAAGLELPLREVLVKTKDTPSQAGLNRQEREKNLEGTLQVVDNEIIWGKTVLLIDDVLTSGSTVSASAELLRQSGAVEVYVLVLAATPKNV